MNVTEAAIRRSFDQVRADLTNSGLLFDWNELVAERAAHGLRRLTWATTGTRPLLSAHKNASVQEYLEHLDGRQYSFLTRDGALLQFSYDLRRNGEVAASRLVWFPCPVEFEADELEFASIYELVKTAPSERIQCKGQLRVDYSPDQAADNHSSTHLHVGAEDFRLPVQRALEPCRFMRLIIRTAYPDVWRSYGGFRRVADWSSADCLTNEDRSLGCLGWQLAVS